MDKGAPETLGELMRGRWRLNVHCRDPQCWRDMPVTWEDIIERFGEEATFSDTTFRKIVCRKCRKRDVLWAAREPYISPPGGAHSCGGPVSPSYVQQPMKVYESDYDRYRRLTALDEMTTSPGEIQRIDDPVRPVEEFKTPLPPLVIVGREMNDNGKPE